METRLRKVALGLLSLGATYVVDARAAVAHTSRVIGESDQTEPLPNGPSPDDFNAPNAHSTSSPDDLSRAIGWMEPARCTVFHLGTGHVATAGHCFLPTGGDARNVACAQTITWGVLDHVPTVAGHESSACPVNGCSAFSGDDTGVALVRGRPWIVAYKCDTDSGSSGSPVFRTDDWTVVGVHDAGILTNTKNNDGWNWATAASHVLAALGD